MVYFYKYMILEGFKKKLLTHVAISLGIIALLALFIVLLNGDINDRVTKIQKAKNEISLRTQTIELLTGTNSDLKKADALLANLKDILPNKDQLIDLPRELQRTAKTFVVDLGFSFGPELAAAAGKPGTIKFTMTAAGTYDNIVDFLTSVESHRYLISLDSVDVHRSGKTNFSLLTSGQIYTK